MREYILKGTEFSIISRSIDNATKCRVLEVTEEYFSVELELIGKYEVDETVELFTMTPKGQLYFETIVKEVKDRIVSLWFPLSYKYLQKREYSRVAADKEVTLSIKDKIYKANLIDLSAGGLKVRTKEQLELLKSYNLEIEIENKQIKCQFEPIRTEALDGYFISSGRFNGISNYDRISLVQYCFIKQIENSNK